MGEYRSICEDLTKNEIPSMIVNDFFVSKKDIKKFYDTYNDYLLHGFSEFDAISNTYEKTLSEIIKEDKNMSIVTTIFLYFSVMGMRYLAQNKDNNFNFNDFNDFSQKEFDFGE